MSLSLIEGESSRMNATHGSMHLLNLTSPCLPRIVAFMNSLHILLKVVL
jgi:hypothetical protein